MAGYNRVVMIGNLTRDPDYRQLSSGQAVCKLGLASNRQFRNKQTGNLVQEVCYVDIDVWGAQAESCRQYLQKGRSVLVEGRLKLDTWEDASGQTRNKHSIVADRVIFLSSQTADQQTTTKNDELSGAKVAPDNELEQDLLNQIDEIKKRSQMGATVAEKQEVNSKPKKKAKSKKQEPKSDSELPATGEVDFKDQPPFQDDLPF